MLWLTVTTQSINSFPLQPKPVITIAAFLRLSFIFPEKEDINPVEHMWAEDISCEGSPAQTQT